jgi:hypothetical protein
VQTPMPLRPSATGADVQVTATASGTPFTPGTAPMGRASPPAAPRQSDVALAAAAPTGVTAAVAVALHLEVPAGVHEVALVGHLAALVVGFGAVLAVDWIGLQWLRRRARLVDVLAAAVEVDDADLARPGRADRDRGAAESGPDEPADADQAPPGRARWRQRAYVHRLHPRLARAGEAPPVALLLRGVASTTVSQLCWWGATVIGFLNARS